MTRVKLATVVTAAWMVLFAYTIPSHAQQGSASEKKPEGNITASQAVYDEKGAEGCLKCHDKAPTVHILKTPHAMSSDKRTPFASHACETCHGPSPEHLIKPPEGQPRASAAISFEKNTHNTIDELNAVCSECHAGGKQMNWQGSAHHSSDVACTSCHTVHAQKDPVLKKTEQAEICFTCHAEQRAESHRPSRHPILEGLVSCGDCHNPHGSPTQQMLVGETLNDTCYQCHAEKRGPFLWEHAPAREDCSLCHASHGSTEKRLLKIRGPFLCQECHMEPFHPSTLYDGSRLSNPVAQHQLLARNCMNCHSEVHGSNHPSGVRWMR